MQYTTLLLAASAALLARAQSDGLGDSGSSDTYISEVCQPINSTGYPDMTAPCNEVLAIEIQCVYGPTEGLAEFFSYFGPDSNDTSTGLRRRQSAGPLDAGPTEQSNATQRVCVCQSQFFDLLNGCLACERKHGSLSEEAFFPPAYVASMSSAYCAVSATPSADLPDFLNDFVTSLPASISSAAAAASTSSFSDPVGNSTAVSLYYTQSVTGSAAWVVAEQTASASSGSAAGTFTSVNSANGQIVATAGASGAAAGGSSGATSSSATSSGGAAVATARSEAAAIAGVLGFAGLVALL